MKTPQQNLKELKEFMETLRDFDTWKEWRNTDPIEELEEVEDGIRKVTMSKEIFDFISNLSRWEKIPYDSEVYDSVLFKTQDLTPIDYGNSLHCHHADYDLNGSIYRLTWTIGSGVTEKPIIEIKSK